MKVDGFFFYSNAFSGISRRFLLATLRSGCFVFAYWMIANVPQNAPPPSIGFPGYIYPDAQGDGGICDMYDGVPCENDASLCCYDTERWCPTNGTECIADNGAYPIGDQPVFANQLTDYLALSVSQYGCICAVTPKR